MPTNTKNTMFISDIINPMKVDKKTKVWVLGEATDLCFCTPKKTQNSFLASNSPLPYFESTLMYFQILYKDIFVKIIKWRYSTSV